MFERTSETRTFGPFRFTPGDGLWRGAEQVPLPPRALAILEALLARPGQLVSKAELLDAGWQDAFVSEASLLEAIHVLRVALGDDRRAPRFIQTVHRRGYRFVSPVAIGLAEAAPAPAPPESAAGAPGFDTETPVAFPPVFSGPEWRLIVRRCGMVLAATVLASLLVAAFGHRPPEAVHGRYAITLDPPARTAPFTGSVAASADGRRFAFVALDAGRPALFLREASTTTPLRLDDEADPTDPFFSPDGRLIGYFAGGLLKVVEPGHAPRVIAAAAPGAGAAWIDASTIVFGGGPGGGLARVSVRGGPSEVLLQPEARSPDVRFGWPDALPDGSLLFTVLTPAGSEVAVLEPGASRHRTLVRHAAFGRFAPTGHLVVERHGQLAAAPFDRARRAVTGAFRPVVDDVASAGAFDGPRYAFSRSGVLVYVPGPAAGALTVQWKPFAGESAPAYRPVVTAGATSDPGPGARPSPDATAQVLGVAWRPDGLELAFAANKTGPYNLYVRLFGGGPEVPLDASPWNQVPTSWSPDGRYLAFTEFHPATGADVWVLDRLTRTKRSLARTPLDETGARYSPDGRALAYLARTGSEWQVVVVPSRGGAPAAPVPARRLYADDRTGGAGGEVRIVLAWFTELARLMREPA